jgi:hypothetical protein
MKLAGIPVTETLDGGVVWSHPKASKKSFSFNKVKSREIRTVVYVKRSSKAKFPAQIMKCVTGEYQIGLNNEMITLDRPLQTRSNQLCAPIRQIIEGEGGRLEWSSQNQTVRALMPTRDIRVRIGSTSIFVNNVEKELALAPYINNGRTMITLGFLPVALDLQVAFDPITGHLDITSQK